MLVNFQGQMVEATPIDVLSENEHWNEYELADGAIIRVKCVVTRISKTEQVNPANGEPLYIVETANTNVLARLPDKMSTTRGKV